MAPPHGQCVLGQAARSAIRRGLNAMHGKENRKIVLRGKSGALFSISLGTNCLNTVIETARKVQASPGQSKAGTGQ